MNDRPAMARPVVGNVPFLKTCRRRAVVLAEPCALLILLPLAAALIGPLVAGDAGQAWHRWWGTPRGWAALGRTVELAAIAATLAVVLAWLLALSARRLSDRWVAALVVAACLPLLVPSSLLATAWIVALGRDGLLTGPVSRLLGTTLTIYSLPGAAVALALRYFGIAGLILVDEQRRQERCWPAARLFRPSALASCWHLRLRPGAGPAMAAWLLVALLAMNDHILPGMLLVSTYGTQVLIEYSALLNPAGAAALAVPAGFVGLVLVALALVAWRRPVRRGGAAMPATPSFPVGRAARAVHAVGAALVLGVAVGIPMAVLAVRAGSIAALSDALAAARTQLWRTAWLATVGAAVATALGVLLAHRWIAGRRTGRWTLAPLVLVNLAVPPSLLAMGLTALFQRPPLDHLADTSWPLVAGYAVRFTPVALLVLYAAWRDQSLLPTQAAQVYRLSPWAAWWHVEWPRRRLGLAAAAVLCGLLVATELEASILLAPPGGSTLGVRLYTLIHTAPDQVVSALAVDLLLLAGPGILLLGWLARRMQQRRGVTQ